MYVSFLSGPERRISLTCRLQPLSLVYLLLFWGPLKLLTLALSARWSFAESQAAVLMEKAQELDPPLSVDFAYTSAHDDTFLNKVIFFGAHPEPAVYKVGFDTICSESLANEAQHAPYFDLGIESLSDVPRVIKSRFHIFLGVKVLPRFLLIQLISHYTRATLRPHPRDHTLHAAVVHGDLNRRNIKHRLFPFKRHVVIDYEFASVRSVSYDYFYFYLNRHLWARNRKAVLSFAARDKKRPLTMTGIDIRNQYETYLLIFLEEWYEWFSVKAHDHDFSAKYRPFISDLQSHLAVAES